MICPEVDEFRPNDMSISPSATLNNRQLGNTAAWPVTSDLPTRTDEPPSNLLLHGDGSEYGLETASLPILNEYAPPMYRHGAGSVDEDANASGNRGDGAANVMFHDGHVESFKFDDYTADVLSGKLVRSPVEEP